MKSGKSHYLSILLCLIIVVLLNSGTNAAKTQARPRSADDSGDTTEFQLSCTVLVNGSIMGGPEGEGGDAGAIEPVAERAAKGAKKKPAKKGRKKRETDEKHREKRSASEKVQLLCDIENKPAQDVAMRAAKKKGKKG